MNATNAGSQARMDIREDEEQEMKCQDVMELFLTAGYFRARIKVCSRFIISAVFYFSKYYIYYYITIILFLFLFIFQGLSNFDKLVGGLVWCLETCTYDVDVDLLFNEGLTIGKKIGLTEKIVTVLQTMKCPNKIEPHQIQGLDFINIFPVVQWLVKKVMETRDAMGDVVRKFAVSQYHRAFSEYDENDMTGIQKEAILQSIRKGYEPKRKYRQQHKVELDREDKVELTLLEYGKANIKTSDDVSKPRPATSTSTNNLSETNNDLSVDKRYKHMMEGMSAENINSTKLDIKAVQSVIDSGDLTKASEQYALLQEKINAERQIENSPDGLRTSIQVLENRKHVLSSRTKIIKSEIEKMKCDETFKEKNEEEVGLKTLLDDLEKEKRDIRLEVGDHERLKKLQSLMNKNETLKKKESEFRQSCKDKMEEKIAKNKLIKSEIDLLKEHNDGGKEGKIHIENIERLREELAHKSKVVADLERKLDEIPSAYELAQYQRRFVELDNQVSAEFSETQKFVILFNTLVDQKSFIEREISLLESILENIPDMKYANSSAKSTFVDKLSRLHQGVEQSKNTLEKNFEEQDRKNQEANNELNKLLEEQRQYTLLVRDMKDEMKKNQVMVDKIENLKC